MALFILTYRYVDDEGFVTQHRPDHRGYLRQLLDAGDLVIGGPLGDPGPPGGLLVFDVESIDRVTQLSDADAFYLRGVVEQRTIRPWTLSMGADRQRPTSLGTS